MPELAQIWHDCIGKDWQPDIDTAQVGAKLKLHLNQDILPLTYIALDDSTAIGMASLVLDDGIGNDIFPWLSSVCVSDNYRRRGIGKLLVDVIKRKAYTLGFRKLYAFAFDKKIADWYESIGWTKLEQSSLNGKPITIMWISVSSYA